MFNFGECGFNSRFNFMPSNQNFDLSSPFGFGEMNCGGIFGMGSDMLRCYNSPSLFGAPMMGYGQGGGSGRGNGLLLVLGGILLGGAIGKAGGFKSFFQKLFGITPKAAEAPAQTPTSAPAPASTPAPAPAEAPAPAPAEPPAPTPPPKSEEKKGDTNKKTPAKEETKAKHGPLLDVPPYPTAQERIDNIVNSTKDIYPKAPTEVPGPYKP